MQITRLGAYGTTELPASQLRLIALEALAGHTRSQEVNVFFMDMPHSGGVLTPITVDFDAFEGDSEEILLGTLVSGKAIAFFLRDPVKTATFVTEGL